MSPWWSAPILWAGKAVARDEGGRTRHPGGRRNDVPSRHRYLKRVLAVAADVPPGVVTRTLTVPEPAGVRTLSSRELTTVTRAPSLVPNWTIDAPERRAPRTTTIVRPLEGPLVGETETTTGAKANVKRSPDPTAEWPWGVVTVTLTVPDPDGAVTRIV